jgi:nucleoside 2-deoxyribosyltransferase
MPITTSKDEEMLYHDNEHWAHVMEELFVPAIERAGFRPIRPEAKGSQWIHAMIIKHLSEADMVLIDASSLNPNVFFEMGVRTSLNKPVAVVRSTGAKLPFDTAGLNTPEYDPDLRSWKLAEQIRMLAEHLTEAAASCAGQNPMWQQFGLTIKAEEPTTEVSRQDARLELLAEGIEQLQDQIQMLGHRPALASSRRVKMKDLLAEAMSNDEEEMRLSQERLEDDLLTVSRPHGLKPEFIWNGDTVYVSISGLQGQDLVTLTSDLKSAAEGSPWKVSVLLTA